MSPRLAHDQAAAHFPLDFASISTLPSSEAQGLSAAAMDDPATQGHAASMTAPPRSRFWTEYVADSSKACQEDICSQMSSGHHMITRAGRRIPYKTILLPFSGLSRQA